MANNSMVKDIIDGQIVTQTLNSMHAMQGGSSGSNMLGSASAQLSAGSSKAAMNADIVTQTLSAVDSMKSSSGSSHKSSYYQPTGGIVSHKG